MTFEFENKLKNWHKKKENFKFLVVERKMNVSPSILKKTLDVKILVFVGLLFLSINVIVRGSENENDLHFFEQNYVSILVFKFYAKL